MTAQIKWSDALRPNPFGSGRLNSWQTYLFAIAATAVTLWFHTAIDGLLGGRPALVMFTLPIMLSAYVGGLRGGLLATALSYFGASYYLLPPLHSFAVASSIERWQQLLLVVAGTVISIVNEALHRARRRGDIATDEYRHAEAVVRASEERLQMVTDNARVGLVMVDRDRRYTFSNTTYAEILGLASRNLVGQRVADVLAPLYEEQIRPRLDRAFDGERVEYELRRPASSGFLYYAVRYEPTIVDGSVSLVVVVITDTTEHKRAEESVRVSEARYRTLFTYAPDGIVIADPESYYIDANTSICRMLGYTRSELIGLHASDIVSQTEIEHIEPALRVINAKSDYQREWQFRRKDGTAFAAEVIATMMPDGNLLGMIRDITERKEMERATRESEERFQTMANSIPQLAWIARADGYIFWYNRRWYEYTGTTPEQMEGWGWQIVHSPEILPTVMERWTGAIDSGEPFDMEFPLLGANGRFRKFLTRVQPLKDSEGRVANWFGTNTDVEALKQAEEEVRILNAELGQRVIERTRQLEAANADLRHSRAELSVLFESLPGLYLVLTPNLKIVSASDAYLKATMTTREGIVGRDIFEVFPDNPNDPGTSAVSYMRASIGRVLQNATSDIMAITRHDIRRPDGIFEVRYWNPINAPMFGVDREIKYIVHRVEDVTEFVLQKSQAADSTAELSARVQKMEAEIFQSSQKLQTTNRELEAANSSLEAYSSAVSRDLRVAEAADRMKSVFLATMSHELRTPLNSIIGFTGIVLQGMAGPLNPEQAKQLGMVQGSAQHLLELINDVLDLSKIEAGQLEVHAEPFDLRASLERVTALIMPLADKKRLTLTSIVSSAVGHMNSDRRRVEQILINLLSNAIKFTESGGVTLTVDRVAGFRSSPDAEPRPALRLQVTDTGMGIKPDDLLTLFQPFRQIDDGLSRQSEGTGLGLAICRRLAILLEGEVSAASEWSKGSVFTVTLPMRDASEP